MTIRHIVFVKFREDAAPAAVEKFIEEVDRLPSINTEVKNWVSGKTPEPAFHNGKFDWALSCDLDNWDSMDRYMWHEAHLRCGAFVAPAVENMMSYDFELNFCASQDIVTSGPVPAVPPEQGRVPTLRGRRPQEARELLKAAGFQMNAVVNQAPGGVWAAGRVVGVDPESGSDVEEGSTITITVTGDWLMGPDLGDGG
ncbi:MAG TPA: Dabb family protein [Dehalococcoidia bacterium]|nr:Dabb family protein [Dehalococcoidia bacterium]